jgi:hypothetical protein
MMMFGVLVIKRYNGVPLDESAVLDVGITTRTVGKVVEAFEKGH